MGIFIPFSPLSTFWGFSPMTRVQKRPPLPCESSPSWQEGAWESALMGGEQEKLAFPCLLPAPWKDRSIPPPPSLWETGGRTGMWESELLSFRLSGKGVERRVMIILAVSYPPSSCFLVCCWCLQAFLRRWGGGEAGGRGGGVQAARTSFTTGRKSNEQEPTFLRGLGHCAAQTAGRERQQPVQTDSSLLLSTRGGERVQYSTALGQRGHLSGPENMPHLSPRTGLTFHWGEGFSHPVLGAGRATPPPLHKQEGQEWIFLS